MYDLSIIIPTLGRKEEVQLLLGSISRTISSHITYEIIIVDQNCNNLIDKIVSEDRLFPIIKHCKVSFRGLSKAKNFGIENSHGTIICFPDDDSCFLDKTVDLAYNLLLTAEYDVVFGKCIDKNGGDSVLNFHKSASKLTIRNLEGKSVESTMFAKRETLIKYRFDETLGIGTFHGAEEGFDIVYRLLKDNKKLFYTPEIKFYHPQVISDKSDSKAIKRVFTYRCGFGKVCVKHKLYSKLFLRLILLIAYIPFCSIFNRKQSRFYISEILGIISGIVVK